MDEEVKRLEHLDENPDQEEERSDTEVNIKN
jgi:hypothetical protein